MRLPDTGLNQDQARHRVWFGSKLFAKVIRRGHNLLEVDRVNEKKSVEFFVNFLVVKLSS